MKFGLTFLLLICLLACELPSNRVVYYEITSLHFSPATTETEDGEPTQANGPVTAANFSIQCNYEIEISGDGDYIEDEVINTNPIDTIQIWSAQTFSGRAPYTSLNSLFLNRATSFAMKLLDEDGAYILYPHFDFDSDYHYQTSYLLNTNATIAPGTYDLYFRCKFHDGIVRLDSIIDVVIQ